MNTTDDRTFAEVREHWDAWLRSNERVSEEDFCAAVRENSADARVYFRGYLQGWRSAGGDYDDDGIAEEMEALPAPLQEARVNALVNWTKRHRDVFGAWVKGFTAGYLGRERGAVE